MKKYLASESGRGKGMFPALDLGLYRFKHGKCPCCGKGKGEPKGLEYRSRTNDLFCHSCRKRWPVELESVVVVVERRNPTIQEFVGKTGVSFRNRALFPSFSFFHACPPPSLGVSFVVICHSLFDPLASRSPHLPDVPYFDPDLQVSP